MNELRQFLRNEFRSRQEKNPNFSLRAFARWLGTSPAQLSQLMSGKRPLTLKMAIKLSEKLNLSPHERLEFIGASVSGLAPIDQNHTETLSEDRFHLIADWYHFAILSLTRLPEAKADSRWIARHLGISVSEAREATDRLVRLGLLELKPKFRQTGRPLSVTSKVPSAAIRKFHRQILELASAKVEAVPQQFRDLQSITLSADVSKLPQARKIIEATINKMERLLESGKPTEVYTLAIQLFPLTHVPSKGENKS